MKTQEELQQTIRRLESRLVQIERRRKWSIIATFVAMVAIMAFVGFGKGVQDEVVAKKITIVNADGQSMMVLGTVRHDGFDESGIMSISNIYGHVVVELGASEYGGGLLNVRDSQGLKSVEIDGHSSGGSVICFNQLGYQLARVSANTILDPKSEGGHIVLHSMLDDPLWSAP